MRKMKILTLIVSLFGLFYTPNAFASNIYNINYSGGVELGASNVNINSQLISNLIPVIDDSSGEKVNINVSTSNLWATGYYKYTEACHQMKYFKIWSNNQINESSGLSYTKADSDFFIDVRFSDVVLDSTASSSEGGNFFPVGVNMETGNIEVGRPIYSDAACTNAIANVNTLEANDGSVFVQMNIKLYKQGREKVYTSDQLYIGIIDIDSAQSYKILNSGNLLNSNNMYAKSVAALQPSDPSMTLRNMFVANGNYIYSQYDSGSFFDITEGADVFVKLNTETQTDGLNLVFGFANGAGSGIRYYAEQYVVTYLSDENGKIIGISNEDVIAGDHPTGSKSKPNEGYEFKYWIADVDVTLEDGTVIKAGEKMTAEQVLAVVVHQNITFTAIHEPEPEPEVTAPNTGGMTNNDAGNIFGAAIQLPVIVAAIVLVIYLYNRKKHTVRFK